MEIIQFKEANCKNCHKCIRNCPVKSIKFSDEQAKIMQEDCIFCGNCIISCPQNAKQINSDLDQVKKYIADGFKVYASLAPSYLSAFPNANFSQISGALKKLGFTQVEETAIGATQISAEFSRLLDEGRMKNIITTCCPTTVLLIEKYYPELLPYIAPVVSPAMAHAKMMREMYGPKIKVVFIGPCISKKYEAANSTFINSVLMFDELASWMKEEGVTMEEDATPAEMHNTLTRLYPVPGGILRTIPNKHKRGYRPVAIDGIERCIEIFDSLRDHPEIEGYFFETSACIGSCAEGPGLKDFNTPFLISKDKIYKQAAKKTETPKPITEGTNPDFSATYTNKRTHKEIPSEETIRDILIQIGKTTPDTMYNCGACGYPTCRDKAIAVYQGKADLKMCIPFMRERAESMSNVILDSTPNALIVLDKDYNIVEFNVAAIKMLDMTDLDYVGLPAAMVLGTDVFDIMREKGHVTDHRVHLNDNQLIVLETIVPITETGNFLVVVKDVTEEEEQVQRLTAMRAETIETAQKVIDKQMRTAQEIASLLGETTGETKAALTRLKKSMYDTEGDQ